MAQQRGSKRRSHESEGDHHYEILALQTRFRANPAITPKERQPPTARQIRHQADAVAVLLGVQESQLEQPQKIHLLLTQEGLPLLTPNQRETHLYRRRNSADLPKMPMSRTMRTTSLPHLKSHTLMSRLTSIASANLPSNPNGAPCPNLPSQPPTQCSSWPTVPSSSVSPAPNSAKTTPPQRYASFPIASLAKLHAASLSPQQVCHRPECLVGDKPAPRREPLA